LKVKDIDMASRSAIVTGKGSKERRVYLSSKAIEALQKYWAARRNSDPSAPVFARHDRGAGRKTKPITTATVRDIVEDVVMVAGLERGSFTPHYFRHAFAIKMLHETHDLALVQDLLGHASPVATRVYAKIYPDELQERHREVFD
jgi:site-specific recombinase XerD